MSAQVEQVKVPSKSLDEYTLEFQAIDLKLEKANSQAKEAKARLCLDMVKDGYTRDQIAEVSGYSPSYIGQLVGGAKASKLGMDFAQAMYDIANTKGITIQAIEKVSKSKATNAEKAEKLEALGMTPKAKANGSPSPKTSPTERAIAHITAVRNAVTKDEKGEIDLAELANEVAMLSEYLNHLA